MSQTATLPDAATAYDTLFDRVHAQVFFNKCAAAGYAPRNAQEAQWMLETAGKLRAVSESQHVKQAAAANNPFYRMNAGLDSVLAQYGIAPTAPQHPEAAAGIKQAADALAQDPVLYNSVLALKAAEAEEMKAQYDAWRAGQAH